MGERRHIVEFGELWVRTELEKALAREPHRTVRAAVGAARVVDVEGQVDRPEAQLPHLLPAAHEAARRHHLAVQLVRKGLARVMVGSEQLQCLPLPGPVLHELAGQLHPVPGYVQAAASAHRHA